MVEPPSLEELTGDVHPILHRLRATAPVTWVPALGRWLVTERSLVLDALRRPETFTVDDPRFTTAQVVGPSMLSLDGAEHARHREPFAAPFRRSTTHQNFAERTRRLAATVVGRLPVDRPVDLRTELAAPLAAETIADALGLVDTSTAELLGWYRSIVAAVEALTARSDDDGRADGALAALRLATDRSRLADAGLMADIDRIGALSPTELCSNTAVMLFGAIETSEGMTTNALFHLLTEPDVSSRLRSDPDLVDDAIEESLRLEPAATFVDRYTTGPVRFGGVDLPDRAAIALSLAAANRDPAHFTHPDAFVLDRTNAGHHLSFVRGPHACVGMHLAWVETGAAIRSLLDRFASVEAIEDRLLGPQGLVFRKPPSLVARCSPER